MTVTWVALDAEGLRDYFAGQALPAIVARPGGTVEGVAKSAYTIADAMLAERLKKLQTAGELQNRELPTDPRTRGRRGDS